MTISHAATPAMLTHILQQAGWLNQGTVTAVEERKSDAFNSQLAFLTLLAQSGFEEEFL